MTFSGDPAKSLTFVLRDILLSIFLFTLASRIASWADGDFGGYVYSETAKTALKALLWCTYWWFQSLVNAGLFCLGECPSMQVDVDPDSYE